MKKRWAWTQRKPKRIRFEDGTVVKENCASYGGGCVHVPGQAHVPGLEHAPSLWKLFWNMHVSGPEHDHV